MDETARKRVKVSSEEKDHSKILEECGFFKRVEDGGRNEEALVWQADFVRRTGDASNPMSRSSFVADMTQRGYDPAWSVATFRGTDIDNSGAINLHEYILGRAALDYDAARDSGTHLVDLRLRVAYFFFDADGDGVLQRKSELREMVRELAQGDAHVDHLMELLPTEADALTLPGFLATALGAFHAAGLSSRDLLKKPTRHPQRTVLEPRTVVAGVPARFAHSSSFSPSSASSTSSPPPPQPQRKPGAGASRAAGGAEGAGAAEVGLVSRRIFIQASAWSGAADESVRPPRAANEELQMDPVMTAQSSWRGPLLSSDKQVIDVAGKVLRNALALTRSLGGPDEACLDDQWMVSGREALCHLFSSRDPGAILRQFQLLAADAKRVVAAQPALVRVRSPAKLFGDVHGQLRDLLCLFREFGFPSHRGGDVEVVSYVFNGDFVDRGEHQLEVVALLFALKVSFPTRIWLLRGNHEFRWMNDSMGEHGYAHACRALFPLTKFRPASPASPSAASSSSLATAAADATAQTYETTTSTEVSLYYEWSHEVFDWLPLAALVGSPTAEPVLVLHGGIGDGSWGLEQLRSEVPRPLKDEDDAAIFVKHALWSDPSDSDAAMAEGVHGSPRGENAVQFGPDVTEAFCARERVSLIVRSHQFVDHGYKVMHHGHLLTVFSARNYFMKQSGLKNDSAILLVAEDDEGNLRVRPKRLLHLEPSRSH